MADFLGDMTNLERRGHVAAHHPTSPSRATLFYLNLQKSAQVFIQIKMDSIFEGKTGEAIENQLLSEIDKKALHYTRSVGKY